MSAGKGGTYEGPLFSLFFFFILTFLLSLLLVVNSPQTALLLHDSSHGFDDGMSFYKAKRGVGVRSFRNTALKNASCFHFGVGYAVPGLSMPVSFFQSVYHDRGYKVHVLAENHGH